MYEVDFLPVGKSNGDAICIQYSSDNGVMVHVVDGAYTDTGTKIVQHIQKFYGANFHISHMVLSHADDDHACGLVEVMKNMTVKHLWMNRPWLFAAETIHHFDPRFTVEGLRQKMREMHPYLVELETLALAQGTEIHDVFQGDRIGDFVVLAPSRARYINLIPDFGKTPKRRAEDRSLGGILTEAMKSARNWLYEAWDIETLSDNPDPVSASNESSVVQMGLLEGKRVVLTADVGPEGLAEAAAYAKAIGQLETPPNFFQVPHHGSRRNVTPSVLNAWLGAVMEKGGVYGMAFCSVGENKDEFPRGQVSNAFLRRGYPVYVTRTASLLHSKDSTRGWGAAEALPFYDKVEDKAQSAAAA